MTIIPAPQGAPLVVVFTTVTITLVGQQALVANGESKAQSVPHSTVLLETQIRTTPPAGEMVTIWEQAPLLEQQSTACQKRVAVMPPQTVPLVNVLTMTLTLVPQQLLVKGGSKVHAVPHATLLFGAQTSKGPLGGGKVTLWAQPAWLLQQSTAVHERVIVMPLLQGDP